MDIISNKKSQAQIISVILIILLVLAAIVIVWQVVQGTVKGGAEEIESQSECIGLNIEITKIVKGDAVTPPDPSTASVTIRPSKDLSSYKVYIRDEIEVEDGGAVTAFSTDTEGISNGISVGDKIEVKGKIGNIVCPTGAIEIVK